MSLWRRILVERRSVVLPLALFLAANLAVLTLMVLPLRHSVEGMAEERNAGYARKQAAARALVDAQQMTTSKIQTTEQLKHFYAKTLAADQFTAMKSVAVWPARTAQALGLQYTSIETSLPTEIRDSRLVKVTSTFQLRGDYANIRKFVYAVEAAEEFLVIDHLKLAQPTAQQANTPALGFELSITTYFPGGQK